jgi:mono/diheme cytochrome c family protein
MQIKAAKQSRVYNIGFLIPAFCAILSCSGKTNDTRKETSVKFEQYYLQGQVLYTNHCSNCHQKGGTGLGRVYPPLNNADYLEGNVKSVICLIQNGIQGKITVNGKEFVQGMPGIPTLTDLEIAEIATYIYNTWENNHGLIEVNQVTQVLKSCE